VKLIGFALVLFCTLSVAGEDDGYDFPNTPYTDNALLYTRALDGKWHVEVIKVPLYPDRVASACFAVPDKVLFECFYIGLGSEVDLIKVAPGKVRT